MEETEVLFGNICAEILYIVPNIKTWKLENPIPANKLRLTILKHWPADDLIDDSVESHFVAIHLNNPTMKQFPFIEKVLKERYNKHVKQLRELPFFEKTLNVQVEACITKIFGVTRYLDGDKVNEATVRMSTADNIVLMLCAMHDFTFRVEDRMLIPDFEPDPGQADTGLVDVVSPKSTTDYTCFCIHNNLHLVAVLLEAKVSYHQHAFAQLLGYYVRACSNIWRPGVCILLTAELMFVVILPFTDPKDTHPLINAISLKPIPYKSQMHVALKLLAVVTHPEFTPKVQLDKYIPVQKDLCFEVETTQMVKLKSLETELDSLKRAYVKLQLEVAKMKCQTIPMTVDVVKQ